MNILFRSTAIITCICLLLSTASCLVVSHKDNGKRGWTKNTNNPHHPKTTNPGKGNKNGKR